MKQPTRTKGKLSFGAALNSSYSKSLCDVDGTGVADVIAPSKTIRGFHIGTLNAQRLAACWNALEDIEDVSAVLLAISALKRLTAHVEGRTTDDRMRLTTPLEDAQAALDALFPKKTRKKS